MGRSRRRRRRRIAGGGAKAGFRIGSGCSLAHEASGSDFMGAVSNVVIASAEIAGIVVAISPLWAFFSPVARSDTASANAFARCFRSRLSARGAIASPVP